MHTSGFRRGAVNECCSTMPVDFVVQTTGHDLTGASALYEYLNASRAMLQPGNSECLFLIWP